MASNIKIKRSAVPGKVPLPADLQLGELAINTYDGKLFSKKDQGGSVSVFEVGTTGPTGYTGSIGYTGSAGYTGSMGDTGIYIGSSAPPSTDVVWLDLSDPLAVDIYGLPPGGMPGQTLAKSSSTDYDVQWSYSHTAVVSTTSILTPTNSIVFASGTITLTPPSAVGLAGKMITIKNTGTGEITVIGSLSQLIDSYANLTLGETNTSLDLVSTGTGWVIV